MRQNTLNWLVCPREGCSARLTVSDDVEARWASSDAAELAEGVLRCAQCGARYPVLLGVALLDPSLGRYLGRFWAGIDKCLSEERGADVSGEMMAFLENARSQDEPMDDDPWSQNDPAVTSRYLQAHFDPTSLPLELPAGWWCASVEQYMAEGRDPYNYLMEFDRRHEGSRPIGLAVDVGSSVGRMAGELALAHAYAIGIDWSFRAVLTARRYYLGVPSPLGSYSLVGEWPAAIERPLPEQAPAQGGLDFVVANATALPIVSEEVECLAAMNILCTLPDPRALLGEVTRVLGPGGTLLLSSPYLWNADALAAIAPSGLSGPDFVRTELEGSFDIAADDDAVPWLLRLGHRRWDVYLCHCIVATRRGGSR